MYNLPDHLLGLEPDVDGFIRDLLDRASAIRLRELVVRRHPEALYWVADRHGVTTVALRTTSLEHEQLVAIMTYRLAQYIMANQLDPRMLHEKRIRHEPPNATASSDIHFIALSANTGEVLAYVTLESARPDHPEQKFGATNRPLFPVESIFGRGLYERLRIVPDLLVSRVRELGRFTKNQFRPALDEGATRGVVEVVLSIFRLLRTGLREEIDVGIGDVEEGVAKKNLEFCQIPIVLLHGVVPYAPEGSFAFFNYQTRTRYPFAFLCSDIPQSRLDAIEAALDRPARLGMMALLDLKSSAGGSRSSLDPPGGLPPLDQATVPQQGGPMAARRHILDVGEWLRSTKLFAGLSVPEAAVLGTFMERCDVEAGTTIVRQGEHGDDLYLIESGSADVEVLTPSGKRVTMKRLGPGDYFGEIGLVVGGERTADVVATGAMTLLRLSHDAYARYLAEMLEVETDLTRTALTRTHETLRKMREAER